MPDIFISKKKKSENTKKSSKLSSKKHSKKREIDYLNGYKKPTYNKNPLAAFSYYPIKANFINQDPEEKVILILRKHPITNLRWIFIAIVMAFAPYFLQYFPVMNFLPENFQLVAYVCWYLLVTAFVFEEFITWYFNVNILTDERIIDVDFVNLIYREMTDANIDQIQDVTVKMGGVLRTIFNYSDIVIQTAAEIPQIEFDDVPKPDKVAKILRQLRIEEEQEKIDGRVR